MSFQFEITLGEATEFGGVWEEQDVLDFLSDEICSKNRFYKKRKIFNFYIDSNLDNLKECKATHYLRYLQENYLRVVDMRELLLLHSHYELDCGLNPIYLNQDGEQIILTYWNDRGRKSTYKVTQAYFYARSIEDARVTLSIDYEGAYHPYHYDVLEKNTRRSMGFIELCEFLDRHNTEGKTPPKLKARVTPPPPLRRQTKIEIIDGIVCIVETEE
ncbi:MAG TPA: hypothetical protein IAA23_01290 [Candidatus Helicobacter avistercoris]|nr:hypothetical protein [Candidatus Helicobacter avistercoris]